MEPDDLSVLAQRAASEGPRWTRAVEDQSAPILGEGTSELGGSIYIVRRAQGRPHQLPLLDAGEERVPEINQKNVIDSDRLQQVNSYSSSSGHRQLACRTRFDRC
jgi:hypothetical protein